MTDIEPPETLAIMANPRKGFTTKVHVYDGSPGGHEGYITGNYGTDGELREVFLHGFGKEGSTMDGWTQFAAILLSTRLQSDPHFVGIARRVMNMKFEPFGRTNLEEIPWCPSIPALIMAWLATRFGDQEMQEMAWEIIADWKKQA